MRDIKPIVDKIIEIGGDKVKFISIYGSVAKGKNTPLSDIDISVYYDGKKEERFNFRKEVLGSINEDIDVQIFQDLPIYIRREVITEGKILYQKDFNETFSIFLKTLKDFEHFKHRLKIFYESIEV
ncbi:MAG: nucleotidyltransferase domain-containing protein [Candidatus Thermoplasmatota archaeon]